MAPNTCKCNPGWSGVGCNTPVCNPECKYGDCIGPNQCRCWDGFGGTSCEIVVRPTIDYAGRCNLTAQCIPSNSHCATKSSTCRMGTCLCKDGYIYQNSRCIRILKLGERCTSAQDEECSDNAYCDRNRGICECSPGFKRGPNQRCASDSAYKAYGDSCSSPRDCFYEMTCGRAGVCACPPGTVRDGDYGCRPPTFGDDCFVDSDCNSIKRSICSPQGFCVCQTGYEWMNFTTELGQNEQICSRYRYIPREKTCSQDLDTVCEPKFACIKCAESLESPICLRPGKPVRIVYKGVGILVASSPSLMPQTFILMAISIFLF